MAVGGGPRGTGPGDGQEAEQLLNLESDTLASLLGYATPPVQSVGGVLDAVRVDPRLDTAGREPLTSVYRWLVRRRSVGDGRRECMPSTMQGTAIGSNPALVYQPGLSARCAERA